MTKVTNNPNDLSVNKAMHDTLFTSTVQHFADVGSHIGIMIAKRSFPAATLPTKRQLKNLK